jgi:hypothetical protein
MTLLVKDIWQRRQERMERKSQERYVAGYDYAAGAILRKEESPVALDLMQNKDDLDWNRGVDGAIAVLVKIGFCVDDRI